MRTTAVSLHATRTSYQTYWDGSIKYSYRDFPVTSDTFSEVRPDRDKSKRPTAGWLYPKPYSLNVSWLKQAFSAAESQKYFDRPSQYGGGQVLCYRRTFGALSTAVGVGIVSSPSPSSNSRRKAELQALGKLKQQRINLGVAFAEANQTAKFVGSAFTAIGNSINYAVNKDWKGAFRTLRRAYTSRTRTRNKKRVGNKLTQDWLGWQYAVKPLMSDVDGAIEALKHRNDRSDWITTVKGISVERDTKVQVLQPGSMLRTLLTTETFRGYFVRLDYHPGITFLSTLSSAGATNALEVLWEKTPLSFVVDWAVPIGEWFSSMDAALGWEFLSGSCTERLEANSFASGDAYGLVTDDGWTVTRSDVRIKTRSLDLSRTVYTSSPIPLLPRVKNPFSFSHVASGLALLTAAATGAKTSYSRRS